MMFSDLGLIEPILRAVAADGYTHPTPIQTKAIPHVLSGADLLGCAQTGTGKTAAFALPILHRLHAAAPQASHQRRATRALILCPTRELASQIGESFAAYGRHLHLKHTVIFGGVGQGNQVRALQHGVDIVIATPGRLLDLMNQGYVDLKHVQILVLDEADRMLDMGFIHDIRKVVKHLPAKRQTLLFSATMPPDIRALAASLLHNPQSVAVNPVSSTVETISQSVYFVHQKQKPALLTHLLRHGAMDRTLVFTRTKHGADRVVKHLVRCGINAAAIHGNKSQNARTRALDSFKSKKPPVLVATDIASRGIDVDQITHVVNYDIPNVPETYVHRIGRTARAGASGVAVSFCDHEERGDFRAIERLTRAQIDVAQTPGDLSKDMPAAEPAVAHHRDRPRSDGRRHGGPNGTHAPRATHGSSAHPSRGHREPASRTPHAPTGTAHAPRGHREATAHAGPTAPRHGRRQGIGQRGRARGRW